MPVQPILVTHPSTGKEIDVAPLFSVLTEFDSPVDASCTDGAADAVSRIIRILTLTEHNLALTTQSQVVDAYLDLYRLKDMFKAIKEV